MRSDRKSRKTIRSNKQPAGFGKPCASCGEPMQRWLHVLGWQPTAGKGWHSYWFTCVQDDCNRYQKVVYEEGSFRHENPYKLAFFNDVALKGRLLKRIDRLQEQVDRDEVSDEEFAARVAEIECSITEKRPTRVDTST